VFEGKTTTLGLRVGRAMRKKFLKGFLLCGPTLAEKERFTRKLYYWIKGDLYNKGAQGKKSSSLPKKCGPAARYHEKEAKERTAQPAGFSDERFQREDVTVSRQRNLRRRWKTEESLSKMNANCYKSRIPSDPQSPERKLAEH